MDLAKKYGITTTACIVAALFNEADGSIKEEVIDNNKVQLLLALEQEMDSSILELLDGILPSMTTQHIVAYRWIDSNNFDYDELLEYNSSIAEAVKYYKKKAADVCYAEDDINGSMLQQASDAVHCILSTTDQNDEVVQCLNDIVDKLQVTSNSISAVAKELSEVIDHEKLDDATNDGIYVAVKKLQALTFFE